MEMLQHIFSAKSTAEWLDVLEAADLWCSAIFSYKDLVDHEGYKALKMEQNVFTLDGEKITTTRCPIWVDGERYYTKKAAPKVGEDTVTINKEFKKKQKSCFHKSCLPK
jgi:crotonobetainyl-CoA:carnitine CoA-transferase CaiB-like acyl-CoA transferase